jgi:hypothetical protein
MMDFGHKSNADLIRLSFRELGENHKNSFIKKYLYAKYQRVVSISQIASVLGRYEDRPLIGSEATKSLCQKFLIGCNGDIGLAKKILAHYE